MFDLVPNLLTTTVAVLFPVFASYKALSTSSPAQLAPWLVYFIIVSLFRSAESFLSIFTFFIPFYAYIRLFIYIWLLFPGESQGAAFLYSTYVQPFLATHEQQIEALITEAHERARAFGLDSLKSMIDFVRQNVLGLQATKDSTPSASALATAPPASTGYVQSLLARFSQPSVEVRDGVAVRPGGDLFNMLSSTITAATSLAASSKSAADIVPPHLKTPDERLSFITSQREKLNVLLAALDREAGGLALDTPDTGMKKSRSEAEFDTISHEDVDAPGKDAGSYWGLLGWGGKSKTPPTSPKRSTSTSATSTGYDAMAY